MFSVVTALFGRYRRAHEKLAARPLRHPSLVVTQASLSGGFLHVAGRAGGQGVCRRITLRSGPARAGMDNPDPAGLAAFSFAFILPWDQDAEAPLPDTLLTLTGEAGKEDIPLHWPSRRLHHLALGGSFLLASAAVIPAAWGWYRRREPRYRTAIRRALGLDEGTGFGPIARDLLPAATAAESLSADLPVGLVIVIPVYNAFDLLQICLTRLAENTTLPWHVVVVDDCSPDPRIRPYLQSWLATLAEVPACRGGELVALDNNLGFVGAANTGLARAREIAPDWPVVLLNTDAFVPALWAERLLAPLADPAVATVTPFTNAAELMSVPAMGHGCEIGPGMADALDALAARIPPHDPHPAADMPTGVGFCMAMAPQFLDRIGLLDTAFGRGYGEEVDWCRKAVALGGRHVAADRLFVEHRGGASFGSATKQAALARSAAIISRRYPAFDGIVQGFVGRDPLRTQRLVLALGLAAELAAGERVPVWLAHAMGGGAEFWLREQIAAETARGRLSVVIRVGGLQRWQIEVHGGERITGATTGDFADVRALMALLPCKCVTYSCAVGDSDPVTLPDALQSLCGAQDRLEVVMHDFFPVSPSFTLLDSDGLWRGVPLGDARGDRAHLTYRPDGGSVPLAAWQAAWGKLVATADAVTVFSESSGDIIRTVWPEIDPARIRLRPHAIPVLPAPVTPKNGAKPVVGMLGNLNPQKGGAVVLALGRKLMAENGTRIVLIGDMDPNLSRPKGMIVHGAYDRAEIAELTARYGITHWIFPALWPETFSYAAREMLATGLPVLSLDLGAQGEAVGAAPNGVLVPYGTLPEIVAGFRKALAALGV